MAVELDALVAGGVNGCLLVLALDGHAHEDGVARVESLHGRQRRRGHQVIVTTS